MKVIKAVLFLVLSFIVMSCASFKFESNPPFTIISAFTTSDNGERIIEIEYTSDKEITFEKMYYLDETAEVAYDESSESKKILASFSQQTFSDVILDSDPLKEFGNKPKVPKEKIPFRLEGGEVAISYKEGEQTMYYKIEKVTKIE
ncbi:hypothetical protein [Tenacibaculum agarivorans]|uniref:hypothetical protein n=1 Tax=Tenacibaculum agarivorans TaxID=1908389 RepID=UPI000A45F91D|nr:hypothetical protein [Tenacibaculum agarivorans]